jgi:hypothetical protein
VRLGRHVAAEPQQFILSVVEGLVAMMRKGRDRERSEAIQPRPPA